MSRNLLLLPVLFFIFLIGCNQSAMHVQHDDADAISAFTEPLEPVEPQYLYGKRVDSFSVHLNQVKPNQNLSDILLKFNVSYQTIAELVSSSRGIFDVRKMRSGNNYCVMTGQGAVDKALCFIYELNPIDYIVFEFGDTLNIYKDSKPVIEEVRTASGVISSSLYETMQENNIDPALAMELSEVYAWAIDFYRIQKGDKFKVIYTEKFVDGESVGIESIKAANFQHSGADLYAFYFEQDGNGDYFDQEAQSLRKAFLQSPVKFSRISSGYTMRRFHPVQKRYKAHLGTDYAAPTGTPIMSTGDGVVVEARYSRYNGRYVKVRHNSTYTTQYLHMSKIASGMKPGRHVKQGEVIGYVGSTGLATGPHVCYRFWKNGRQVNHRAEKLPPSEPVKKEYYTRFEAVKTGYMKWLDKIPYPGEEIPQEQLLISSL